LSFLRRLGRLLVPDLNFKAPSAYTILHDSCLCIESMYMLEV
jgi:hypothetical protein